LLKSDVVLNIVFPEQDFAEQLQSCRSLDSFGCQAREDQTLFRELHLDSRFYKNSQDSWNH